MYNPNLSFHFVGIGGSGMSGLAEILLDLGFKVSGSDLRLSPSCDRLVRMGARIGEGHDARNVPAGCSLVVYSSAVDRANPELCEARSRGIPVVRRAEVLAELMRLKYGIAVAGSHGKTTTTSMVAAVLEEGRLDPTVVIGGQVKSSASGGKLGRGDFLVAESDESDRSFLLLKPTIAVVTNIDEEHLSAYGSLRELEAAFEQFTAAIPFYGLAVLCIDDTRVADLARRFTGRKVTYGFTPGADVRAERLEFSRGGTAFRVTAHGRDLGELNLPMPGRHLALNALAAIAVGLEVAIPVGSIRTALAAFPGVKRRLEVIGTACGVTVMSDYGHHPTELAATIRAVREGWGASLNKLHVVFQPHRYSRTKDCFAQFIDCFDGADSLTITEIYSAGEAPIDGISGALLCDAISHPERRFCASLDDIAAPLSGIIQRGDVILCLGAGSIGAFAESLPARLESTQEDAA